MNILLKAKDLVALISSLIAMVSGAAGLVLASKADQIQHVWWQFVLQNFGVELIVCGAVVLVYWAVTRFPSAWAPAYKYWINAWEPRRNGIYGVPRWKVISFRIFIVVALLVVSGITANEFRRSAMLNYSWWATDRLIVLYRSEILVKARANAQVGNTRKALEQYNDFAKRFPDRVDINRMGLQEVEWVILGVFPMLIS